MKRAGDILGAFLDENVIHKAKEYSGVFSSWKQIAGEHIGCHSKIIELDQNVLIVEAEHPSWIQLIQLKQNHILHEVTKRFPGLKITGIAIRLQRDGEWQKPAVRILDGKIGGSDDLKTISQNSDDRYASISDENFKEQLKRLENTILTQKRFK